MPRDVLAHIADLHFWRVVTNPLRMMNKRFWGNLTVVLRRRREFAMDRAEEFADAVARSGVSSVLLTGDFASTSLDEELGMGARFAAGLRDRGLRVFVIRGNHDVYTFGAARDRRFERHFGAFLPTEGYPTRVTLPGGTPLILIDTSCPRHFCARGRIDRGAVDRVRELLEGCGPAAITAAHYPVLNRTHGYASHRLRRLVNGEALRRALGESGVRVLHVAGHVHRFSFECDSIYSNVRHLTTGGFFLQDSVHGVQGEFSVIESLNDRFRVVRHVRRDTWISEPAAPNGGFPNCAHKEKDS